MTEAAKALLRVEFSPVAKEDVLQAAEKSKGLFFLEDTTVVIAVSEENASALQSALAAISNVQVRKLGEPPANFNPERLITPQQVRNMPRF